MERIHRTLHRASLCLMVAGFPPSLPAEPIDTPGEERIRAAVVKSLPLLAEGARGSVRERARCFTCHNQALPILALTTARQRGLTVDEEELARQLRFTAGTLEKNRERYREGKGQGGQALTAGYALWSLDHGGWKPDATTAAVTEYLLRWQRDRIHWTVQSDRPPSEAGPFAVTYFALYGLNRFGRDDQADQIADRVRHVENWLLQTPAQSMEDKVFRLRALETVDAAAEERLGATQLLLEAQRPDGGWAQLDAMESDAYATGTAMVALHRSGGLPTTHEAYRQGVNWLLSDQREDGSWRVESRSRPIQKPYESGYPHDGDQFISITAAGWATTALALALPEPD